MSSFFLIFYWILELYTFVLFSRIIFDLVQVFSRSWEPKGMILVLANFVYRATDPPLRFLGRYIPPIRIGAIAFDVGFLVLFFGIKLLQRIITFGIFS